MLKPDVLIDGDPYMLIATWGNFDGNPDTPTSVAYQVFDIETGDALSAEVPLVTVAPIMEFVIPGSDMPADPVAKRRRVSIQVRAVFQSAVDTKTLKKEVFIERRFSS